MDILWDLNRPAPRIKVSEDKVLLGKDCIPEGLTPNLADTTMDVRGNLYLFFHTGNYAVLLGSYAGSLGIYAGIHF